MRESQSSRDIQRRRWGVVFVLAAVIVTSYVVKVFLFTETVAETATRLHGCLERSDASCLLQHVHAREKKELDLTKAKLQNLLKLTSDRIVRGGQPGQLTVNVQREQGMATAQRDYEGKNGVRVAMALTVQAGDDGSTCSPLVWQLVKEYALARALERTASPAEVPAAFAAVLRESREEFVKIGLSGVVEPGTSGKMQPWDELIQHWEGVAVRSNPAH